MRLLLPVDPGLYQRQQLHDYSQRTTDQPVLDIIDNVHRQPIQGSNHPKPMARAQHEVGPYVGPPAYKTGGRCRRRPRRSTCADGPVAAYRHLGVAARPYSFAVNGLVAPPTPVCGALIAPDAARWTRGPDDAQDRVTGPALDFYLVVTRRRHRDDTTLEINGLVADKWMTNAQAYAGTRLWPEGATIVGRPPIGDPWHGRTSAQRVSVGSAVRQTGPLIWRSA
jgi:hypothetical protein